MILATSVIARDDQREVNNLPKLHGDQQHFVFRHRGSKEPSVTAGEIEVLKSKVQRALDLT
jgi:hypothetical protein